MEKSERLVICGEAASPRKSPSKKTIHLNLWGTDPNITLEISDISRKMVRNIDPIFKDLLEISTYIYCADQAIPRGGSGVRDFGSKWRRPFKFIIPVRRPGVWSSNRVQSILKETLGFLSEDNYEFEFLKLKTEPSENLYFKFGNEINVDFDEVILFSGGLDSLAGAVQESVVDKRKVILVSHRSSPVISSKQKDLVSDLNNHCKANPPFHIPVWIHKDRSLNREYTQRTRSFLYASLAAVVASTIDADRIRFYENGVTSLNLPITEQTIGARATRTTHPKAIRDFSELFSALFKRKFGVENPFFWKTKTDIINIIGGANCADLIKHSVSCSATWEMTKIHPHCGKCVQCIDRRFAALASKYSIQDPGESYKIDLLIGARVNDKDRTMIESYAKTSRLIAEMSPISFFTKYGEIARAIPHIKGTADEVGRKNYDLHQRHASQVGGVIDKAIQVHAREIREGSLPDTCLVILAIPDEYRITVEDAARRDHVFRKDGEKWTLAFDKKSVTMNHRKGMDFTAYLLQHPREDFDVTSLYHAVTGFPVVDAISEYSGMTSEQLEDEGLKKQNSQDEDWGSDPETIKACENKVSELKFEIAEAEANNQTRKKSRLQEDLEKYESYLSKVKNIKGRPRITSGDKEKARKNVTIAIKRAITAISKEHDSLGLHLRNSISTGTYCTYNPDKQIPWKL